MGLSHQYHGHLVLLFSCLLLLLVSRSSAQGHRNISLGTSFPPPFSWPSPSGDFAFGFRPLETDGTLFLLAVWFDKVPNKTVVWCANGDNPVRDGSTAQLVAGGWLSLKDHTGQVVWNTSGVGVATHAAMLDSGNLVLVGADSATVWQSFNNPTDTILPTQVLGLGSMLYARLMDTDYSKGRFQLVLQNDGNLVFYPVAVPTGFKYDSYWQSGTNRSGIRRLVFDEDQGSIYLSDQTNRSLPPLISSNFITGKYYQRAALDPDGVFRQYALPKDSDNPGGGWEVQGSVASNICDLVRPWYGSGACGFNSYCQLDASMRVDCKCPPRYSFVDPGRKYKGCKPDFAIPSCEPGSESQYEFITMTNVHWPPVAADKLQPINESECRDNCFKDCFCIVAIYEEGTCWKKSYPMSSGNAVGVIGRNAFIKVSKFETSPMELKEKKFRRTWVLAVSLLLGFSVLLHFAQIGGACFYIKNRRWPLHGDNSSAISTLTLRYFTYKELEEATRGFSEEVGRGGFGTVYKGFLPIQSSTVVVAVKKLHTLQQETEKDFSNEVRTIGQTYHKNLVRLYGFCKEGKHRLLVYEFMSNGSLNRFLFSAGDRPEWSRRVQIALGIASGLAYLHEGCKTKIIHCDIKPQNILLDDDLTARIADFGLAKLLGIQQTRTSTGLRGTIGYFAPEWFKNIQITAKVDVYSFGVMLLEIICCRRNLNWEMGESSGEKINLADWAIECYRNGRLNLLVDDDVEAAADVTRLERFVMVAISCIQEEPWLRPSMKKVIQMLEGAVAVSVPPNVYAAY